MDPSTEERIASATTWRQRNAEPPSVRSTEFWGNGPCGATAAKTAAVANRRGPESAKVPSTAEKTATARERKCRIATSSNVPSTGLGSLGESGAIAPKLARVVSPRGPELVMDHSMVVWIATAPPGKTGSATRVLVLSTGSGKRGESGVRAPNPAEVASESARVSAKDPNTAVTIAKETNSSRLRSAILLFVPSMEFGAIGEFGANVMPAGNSTRPASASALSTVEMTARDPAKNLKIVELHLESR